jgi:hypothetical protein
MKKSWKDVIKVHPAADMFPMMSETELKELGEDIKANGLRSPFILWADKPGGSRFLLDGRNRFEAAERAGLLRIDGNSLWLRQPDGHEAELEMSIEGGNLRADPYALAVSYNIHRRHLTAEQKRELIAKLIKATPEKSNREIAKLTKTDHKTVGTQRTKLQSTGEIPQLKQTVGADGKARPIKQSPKPAPTNKSKSDAELVEEIKATSKKLGLNAPKLAAALNEARNAPPANSLGDQIKKDAAEIARANKEVEARKLSAFEEVAQLAQARSHYAELINKLSEKERMDEIHDLLAKVGLSIHKHFVTSLRLAPAEASS